ncbi:hypothetical protein N1851_017629 [Merluccius polli]|uniref:Uncharacterized protein n=1 Tax=Merluccius polli TaxID=89951 RepID=A0AA47MQ00_MERPO|nr:hypothetical protein N1851_017629 [Merluccius polli]
MTLFWLLQEPLIHGGRLGAPCWARAAVTEAFSRAGILTLGDVITFTGPDLQDTAGLGGWSERIVGRLLDHWRSCLTGHERLLLTDYSSGVTVPCPDDPSPTLSVRPCWTDCQSSVRQCEVNLQEATGKVLSALMVECLNRQKMQRRADSP